MSRLSSSTGVPRSGEVLMGQDRVSNAHLAMVERERERERERARERERGCSAPCLRCKENPDSSPDLPDYYPDLAATCPCAVKIDISVPPACRQSGGQGRVVMSKKGWVLYRGTLTREVRAKSSRVSRDGFEVHDSGVWCTILAVRRGRFRAKREQLERFKGLLPQIQGLDCLMCAIFAQQR